MSYEVDVAANGREALDMIQNSSYGLVLMDCQMPAMGGVRSHARYSGARWRSVACTDYRGYGRRSIDGAREMPGSRNE
jgi:DNA-binding NtrC family response regulator